MFALPYLLRFSLFCIESLFKYRIYIVPCLTITPPAFKIPTWIAFQIYNKNLFASKYKISFLCEC